MTRMSKKMRSGSMLLETAQEQESEHAEPDSSQDKKRQRPSNPFKIPDDKELMTIHEKMKESKDEKSRLYGSPRENFRSLTKVDATPISAEEKALDALIPPPDSSQNKEGLRDFIAQKREIFLAQLAIDTKREELQRLERLEREEEANLKAKEDEIDQFREQFRAFLESDGQATMEARKSAENKSKDRLKVSMQIKQVSSQISTLRNEIAHQDEKLQECQDYQQFLESLTPPDWRKRHPPPEMYFTDPQQLLTIIVSLEEQNMFLIRHCQEAEEAVERYRTKFNKLLEERDGSMTEMMQNREEKQKELQATQEKNQQYKVEGEFRYGNELSESELSELQTAIIQFHEVLGFDAASSNDIAMMLRRIENKMEELIQKLERLDQVTVKALALEKEHLRREQQRTFTQENAKQQQMEKMRKAVAQANKPIKRKTGRPLYERMVPKKGKSRQEEEEKARALKAEQAADEELLFGQIWD